ncbi:MAG: hypothetical protein HUU45_06590 [Leptospiraceae bacterium]|nr:hypothetical protein [Leptospiraceae bacterium]
MRLHYNTLPWVGAICTIFFSVSIFFFSLQTYANQKLKPLKIGDDLNFEGISPKAKHQFLKFITLDGFRLSADFYKSVSKERGTFVIVPDLHDGTYQSVKIFAEKMVEHFNVIILYPRGHVNSEEFLGTRKFSLDLVKTKKDSFQFIKDYKAILEIIQDRKGELGVETNKCIFVTGRFHSNLIVTEILEGVSGLVLLSARKEFYKTPTSEHISKLNQLPILILADKYRESELKEAFQPIQNSKIQMEFFEKIGNGFSILLKRPDTMTTIQNFAESIQ